MLTIIGRKKILTYFKQMTITYKEDKIRQVLDSSNNTNIQNPLKKHLERNYLEEILEHLLMLLSECWSNPRILQILPLLLMHWYQDILQFKKS